MGNAERSAACFNLPMFYSNDEKITAILEWSKGRDDFNRMPVLRMQEHLDTYGIVDPIDEELLDNVIDKWGINVHYWKDY